MRESGLQQSPLRTLSFSMFYLDNGVRLNNPAFAGEQARRLWCGSPVRSTCVRVSGFGEGLPPETRRYRPKLLIYRKIQQTIPCQLIIFIGKTVLYGIRHLFFNFTTSLVFSRHSSSSLPIFLISALLILLSLFSSFFCFLILSVCCLSS
jgi:hypothetical protein